MEYRIERFEGINQSAVEPLTDWRYAAEAANVATADGALTRARGVSRYTQTALDGGIGTLAGFYPRVMGATNPRLVAVNEAGVYEWRDAAWQTLYGCGGSAFASALNYQHDDADILLLADGTRPVLRWDGVNPMMALTGCEQLFSQLTLHYERVWGAGIASEPDAVYWSRAYNPQDWTGDSDAPESGGGVAMIPTWNGGRVLALRALYNDVLVFKDDDLYRIVGTYPGNYEIVRVHGVVGPIARNSIVAAADACYFLSRSGLCAYNGVTVAPVGAEHARGIMRRVNPQAAPNACACAFDNTLYLALPLDGSDENNAVLEIGLADGRYLLREGVNVRSFLEFEDALLFADRRGLVCRYGVGDTDDGEAINAYWRSPWTDLREPGTIKWFDSLSMFARGEMRLTLTTDTCAVTRHLILGDTMRPVTVRLGGGGRRFHLRIENVNGSDFTVAPGLSLSLYRDY